MRFLRRFAAVVAVVAVVVLLGLAWNRFAPRLPGEGPTGQGFAAGGRLVKVLPPGVKVGPGGKIARGAKGAPGGPGLVRSTRRSGTPGLLLGDLLEGPNLGVLRHTALIEAAVIAAVVIADASYLEIRRGRRRKARAARRPT